MERNTPTTIGELNEGDRFYFSSDAKRKVLQITEKLSTISQYNSITEQGKSLDRFDSSAKINKPVIFLRHKNETI